MNEYSLEPIEDNYPFSVDILDTSEQSRLSLQSSASETILLTTAALRDATTTAAAAAVSIDSLFASLAANERFRLIAVQHLNGFISAHQLGSGISARFVSSLNRFVTNRAATSSAIRLLHLNDCSAQVVALVCDALLERADATTLQCFDVTECDLEKRAGSLIRLVKSNRSLRVLRVGGNYFSPSGLIGLFNALAEHNSTIRIVSFAGSIVALTPLTSSTVVSSNVVEAISRMLRKNSSLYSVDLSVICCDDETSCLPRKEVARLISDIENRNFSLREIVLKELLPTPACLSALCARNSAVLWSVVHATLVDIVIALAALDLVPYVILWITDFLPFWSQAARADEVRKIRLIDSILRSIRNVRETRVFGKKKE
jgi:hypothetical protein